MNRRTIDKIEHAVTRLADSSDCIGKRTAIQLNLDGSYKLCHIAVPLYKAYNKAGLGDVALMLEFGIVVKTISGLIIYRCLGTHLPLDEVKACLEEIGVDTDVNFPVMLRTLFDKLNYSIYDMCFDDDSIVERLPEKYRYPRKPEEERLANIHTFTTAQIDEHLLNTNLLRDHVTSFVSDSCLPILHCIKNGKLLTVCHEYPEVEQHLRAFVALVAQSGIITSNVLRITGLRIGETLIGREIAKVNVDNLLDNILRDEE